MNKLDICQNYENSKRIHMPRYKGKEISMQEALEKLKEILSSTATEEILHYRGSGDFGLMQEVTDHFFAAFGATLTDGNLCDGAGKAGITEGRGSNHNMPLSEIAKSELVIIWGSNPHATSAHLLELIKDKTLIVIDPVKTEIAKMAELHIQIKPHGDLYLALMMSRFLHIEHGCDEAFLQEYASEFEEFYELTQTVRIKATLDKIDVSLGQIGEILKHVKNKKVAIVCGTGIQKFSSGADVMRAIDAFAVGLGLFAKEGCGVAYMQDSKELIPSPFETNAKRVSKVNTEFGDFKTLFVQGANPLAQMPNSLRVIESVKKVQNLIYFGLEENETSEMADLLIPAKSFLFKNDLRLSYSNHAMMHRRRAEEYGISEYDLSAYLSREFGVNIKEEALYLEHFKSFIVENMDGSWHVKSSEKSPYKNGFDTDDGEFIFLEEFDMDFDMNEKLFLVTPKSAKSLNSQFHREEWVYLNPLQGFTDGEEVTVSSACGSVKLKVKVDEDIREDCVLIYSGTKGVNNLTSSKHSYDGKNAVYQENKVEVNR